MNSAENKPVKIHEFMASAMGSFLAQGEHMMCAVILGPDLDDPNRHTLHLRANATVVDLLRAMPRETRTMIIEHQERLLREFRSMLEAA